MSLGRVNLQKQDIDGINESLDNLDKQRKKIEARYREIRLKLKERGKIEGQAAFAFPSD